MEGCETNEFNYNAKWYSIKLHGGRQYWIIYSEASSQCRSKQSANKRITSQEKVGIISENAVFILLSLHINTFGLNQIMYITLQKVG